MLERIAMTLHGTTKVNVWGNEIDFKPPFRRAPMCQLIKEMTGYDVENMSESELFDACKKLGVETNPTMGKGKLIDAIFGEKCEHTLIQPTFVTDYPIEMSPLCKRHRNNPNLTERFELFVNGKELANAYSELNDPIDQLGRFQEQLKLSEKGDDEAMFIDMDFVRALEYGMPPTSGMGIGIDRLVMMMTGAQSIQDVLLFPQMKPEVHEKNVEDEGADLVAHGVDEAWVPVLQKAGIKTFEQLKGANPNKLFNDLGGLRKKMKLDIPALKREQFDAWLND
jgi:lysyl-tRNA synthetase class 2